MKIETKSSEQYHIESLSNKRYELLDKQHASWNEEKMDYDLEIPEIDELANEILKYIKLYRNNLTFEFIFDELTKLGQAPNLVYDDNGNFAITSAGIQEVTTELSDLAITSLVTKEQWKPTIREALDHYLDGDE